MPSKKKDVKKDVPEPYGEEWDKIANSVARDFAPTIYPCKKCNYPVVEGYCCENCLTSEPR